MTSPINFGRSARASVLGLLIIAMLAVVAGATSAAPALAVPCEERCEDPDDGGGGGGGGGGGEQAPVTVTGQFRYRDTDIDPATGVARLRPIAFARVEIWRYAPRGGPFWTWAPDETAITDANGSISVPMPFETSGIVYALRVTATNYAAVVYPNDVIHTVPFHQEPGEPDGANIRRTPNSPGVVIDFSYDFVDAWTPQHFNIAETIRHGFDYVSARRDPAETDLLPPAGVQPTSVTNSWYNAPFDTVVITSGDVFSDLLILHEYTHWVEEQIGSFPWNLTFHDGCIARDIPGAIVNSAGHAWMEGFADYLAQAIAASVPQARLAGTGIFGFTSAIGRLETPGTCPQVPAEFAPETVEIFTAASLWDLIDDPADSGAAQEAGDTLSRFDVLNDTSVDTHVVQIMDRELDMATSILGPFPTILDFRAAWARRQLPVAALDQILRQNGIPVPAGSGDSGEGDEREDPDEGDGDGAPSEEVCRKRPWTPGC